MAFVIDQLNPNKRAKKILDEVGAIERFCGRKPQHVALFPSQFDFLKRSCLRAHKRQCRAELKAVVESGKRLKPGALTDRLEQQGYRQNESSAVIKWCGIVLYDKTSPETIGEKQC